MKPSSSRKGSHDGPVRLRDIAERLGVSAMTVSLAMRAHPSISKKRIEEVKRTAAAMGYRPNAMASALAHRKWTKERRSIAATLAWINLWEEPAELRRQPVFDRFWQGAAAGAESLGYRLEEFACDEEMPRERLQKVLLARNVQGVIVPPHPKAPDWAGWDFDKFSIVRLGHSVANLPVDLISVDQVRVAMEGAVRIHEHGYHRIGLATSVWADRNTLFQAGFLLARNRIGVREFIPMLGLDDLQGASSDEDLAKLDQWLRRHRPDAILTDVKGMGLMLERLGRRVPESVGLALMGADAGLEAGMDQNPLEVGRMAVEILVSLVHRGVRGIPETHRLHLAAPMWRDGLTLPRRAGF